MTPTGKRLEEITVLANQVPVDIPTLMNRVAKAILAERSRIAQIIMDEQAFLTAEDKRALIERILE